MTAPVLERVDAVTSGPRCVVEDEPDGPACGVRAVAELFMSCPGGHPEGVLVCGRHRAVAHAGGLDCFTCDPPTAAFVVTEVPL